jgi:hypothetical protein
MDRLMSSNKKKLARRYRNQGKILYKTSFMEYIKYVRIIISTKDTGIANRMKSLASTIRLSRYFKKDFGVYWENTINIQNQDGTPHRPLSKFSDLFVNKFEIQDLDAHGPLGVMVLQTWRLLVWDELRRKILKSDGDPALDAVHRVHSAQEVGFLPTDKIGPGFAGHTDKHAPTGIAIDFEYDKIPERLKKTYSDIFSIFELKRHIQKRINGFAKRHFNEHTISVHIRTYNDAAGTSGKKRGIYSFNIDSFISQMKNQDDNCNFFVCSDSDEAIEQIKDVFGDRIATFDSGVKTTEEDIIDLYLLSKNKLIIGTKNSTFTEVAWWLSDCKMNVIIV